MFDLDFYANKSRSTMLTYLIVLRIVYLVFSESFKVLSEFWGILQDVIRKNYKYFLNSHVWTRFLPKLIEINHTFQLNCIQHLLFCNLRKFQWAIRKGLLESVCSFLFKTLTTEILQRGLVTVGALIRWFSRWLRSVASALARPVIRHLRKFCNKNKKNRTNLQLRRPKILLWGTVGAWLSFLEFVQTFHGFFSDFWWWSILARFQVLPSLHKTGPHCSNSFSESCLAHPLEMKINNFWGKNFMS